MKEDIVVNDLFLQIENLRKVSQAPLSSEITSFEYAVKRKQSEAEFSAVEDNEDDVWLSKSDKCLKNVFSEEVDFTSQPVFKNTTQNVILKDKSSNSLNNKESEIDKLLKEFASAIRILKSITPEPESGEEPFYSNDEDEILNTPQGKF